MILLGTVGSFHVLVWDKQSDASLKDKALTGLLAALTASVGFYAGKR
jgi:hypothetical protein